MPVLYSVNGILCLSSMTLYTYKLLYEAFHIFERISCVKVAKKVVSQQSR